jgi:putative transferase (TIGR04331 family)
MKRFLITTADERTWRRDRPVLFLGEWCRLHDRRASWLGLDAEVVPYHWDDRDALERDYPVLQAVYEDVLHRTSAALNVHHGTAHSVRYWRILIGPWLFQFVHVLFDRWTMAQRAADGYDIDETLIYDPPSAAMIPSDLSSARFQDVTWNHYVFGRVIAYQNRISARRIPAPDDRASSRRGRAPIARAVRTAVRERIGSLLGWFTRSDEALVIRTYLPRVEELKLQLALGQVPKLWTPPAMAPVPPDLSHRRRFVVPDGGLDGFPRFVAAMVPEQMPTAFLEGYLRLTHAAARLPWPSKPRVIFTSNLDWLCTVFQEWAAAKAEAGHPLVIGQHGGFVGTARRHPVEDHQLKTSDRYLSWGWQDGDPRVHPAMAFTNVGKPLGTWRPSGNLLLVTVPMSLLGFRCFSQPVGPNQSAAFVSDQIRFAKALDSRACAALTLRIDEAADVRERTGYVARWRDAIPGVRIDPSTTPIEGPLRTCRLFVYTYNSTGFLESMARNIPTVLFWNPRYFELRDSAQPHFDRLADVRIFHATPESAARHVNGIWDDVAGWWHQPAVQETRRAFCERYARMPDSPLRVLKEALLTTPVGAAVEEPAS